MKSPDYNDLPVFSRRLNDLFDRSLDTNYHRTQKAEAAAIGIPEDMFGKYLRGESGRCQIDIESLNRIADYYQVTADYLLGRTDIPAPDADIDYMSRYTGLCVKSLAILHEWTDSEKWYRRFGSDIDRLLAAWKENEYLFSDFRLYLKLLKKSVIELILGNRPPQDMAQLQGEDFRQTMYNLALSVTDDDRKRMYDSEFNLTQTVRRIEDLFRSAFWLTDETEDYLYFAKQYAREENKASDTKPLTALIRDINDTVDNLIKKSKASEKRL